MTSFLLLLALWTSPSLAEEPQTATLELHDGTVVTGALLGRTDAAYVLRGDDGEPIVVQYRDVAKAELPQSAIGSPDGPPEPLALPPGTVPPEPAPPMSDEELFGIEPPLAEPAATPSPASKRVTRAQLRDARRARRAAVPERVFGVGGAFSTGGWWGMVPPSPYDRTSLEEGWLGTPATEQGRAMSFDVGTLEMRFFNGPRRSVDVQLDVWDLVALPTRGTPTPFAVDVRVFQHKRLAFSPTFAFTFMPGGGMRVEGQAGSWWGATLMESARMGFDISTLNQAVEVGIYARGEIGQELATRTGAVHFDFIAAVGLELVATWNKTR